MDYQNLNLLTFLKIILFILWNFIHLYNLFWTYPSNSISLLLLLCLFLVFLPASHLLFIVIINALSLISAVHMCKPSIINYECSAVDGSPHQPLQPKYIDFLIFLQTKVLLLTNLTCLPHAVIETSSAQPLATQSFYFATTTISCNPGVSQLIFPTFLECSRILTQPKQLSYLKNHILLIGTVLW